MSIKPKQRPIIFSADMVRAILADKKTQTRRVVKDEFLLEIARDYQHILPHLGTSIEDGTFGYEYIEYGAICGEEHLLEPKNTVWQVVKCPYGVIGDQLWVREVYADILWEITASGKEIRKIIYKADEEHGATIIHPVWKTPLFMPRAASRILLEITDIRVERVQDISEQDAIAEGIEFSGIIGGMNHHQNYCGLWSRINGNESWIENPWVWVVEFKRIEEQP